MPAIPLGIGTYKRDTGHYPIVRLLNMFLEKDPTNVVDGMSRLQRPGMTSLCLLDASPVRGIFRQAGTFNGDYIAASGLKAYRVTSAGVATALGAITGTDQVRIAATATRAIIVANGIAYSTDGTTIVSVVMPDGQSVSDVAVLNGFFILTVSNSQKFYWIAPGGVDPDPLDFASAESTPDNLVGVLTTSDEVWFFGTDSTEVWYATSDADAPFQRVQGRLYDKGAANRDTIVRVGETPIWAANDGVVYGGVGGTPARISENGIEERLRIAGRPNLRAWTYSVDGHTFYLLRAADLITYAYDTTTPAWSEFQSFNRDYWRAHVGAQADAQSIVCGDSETGQLWKLDPTVSNDAGDPLLREVSGLVSFVGRPQPCFSVSLQGSVGWPSATVANPIMLMRWSDDLGQTWDYWRQIQLGKQGEYSRETVLRKLGMMRDPGRLFEFRITDDAVFRISYARLNEKFS